MTNKVVVLRFDQGSFSQGFALTLQIGTEGARPTTETTGILPPAAQLPKAYQKWQTAYRRLGLPSRIEPVADQITNVSRFEDCRQAAIDLHQALHQWLNSAAFRPTQEKLLEQLSPCDRIRIILQTDDPQVQKLPWHIWELLERYPLAEIALAAPTYANTPVACEHPPGDVRILAVLGNSEGIEVAADQALLTKLPQTHIKFLDEPSRRQLNDHLWEQHWDILFFAGHSRSRGSTSGQLCLNDQETLDIGELHYALKKSVARGLKLAIFNSCDGLGLGRALADLQIPQLIVMREPVPDPVAQEFLKYFLQSYAHGAPLYLAMRDARERLQGLEPQYPCATWLPIICQNPAVMPPTWSDLCARTQPPSVSGASVANAVAAPRITAIPRKQCTLLSVLLTSCLMAAGIMTGRWVGALQPMELWALDRLFQLRPLEKNDPRLLIITISEAEIQAQGDEDRRGSLADSTLNQLLSKLEQYQPRVVGLDIYRDFPVREGQPDLQKRLQSRSLVGLCKGRDPDSDPTGIAPPPELPVSQVGFSDFLEDRDGILRRQLLYMTPEPASPCTASYAFSTLLAFHYLSPMGIQPSFTNDNQLQLGKTVVPTLRSRTGGYQAIDAGGIQALLNYRALPSPQDIAPRVTLQQVLQNQVNAQDIKDKVVLIGVTANSTSDLWLTPYGGKVPGVFVQAQMTSQILSAVLDRRPLLWAWPQWGDAIWVLLWSTTGGVLVWRFAQPRQRVIVCTATLGVLTGSCLLVLMQGGWIPLIPAMLAFLATILKVMWTTPGLVKQPSQP